VVGSYFPGTRARRLGEGREREMGSVRSVKASAVRPRRPILSESYDRYQRYDGLYRYPRHHLHAATARSSLEFF
jgi:hypothetical protein